MQQILKIEPIHTIQVHMHPSHLYTFHNTFYIEVLKKYANGIIVNIVEHEHPIHRTSQLPFAIVNATHIVPKCKLQGLVDSVCTNRPVKVLFFKPIVQLCEQIAGIGRITSQQPNNPYYLLLSPLKKYQVYKFNNTFKQQFYQNTQYFNPQNDELNKQHFLYKLDILSTYVNNIDKNPIVILCIYALMKSLKIDNKMLYQTVVKNQVFRAMEDDGFRLVQDPVRAELMNEARFIATLPPDAEGKGYQQYPKPSPNIFANPKLQFLSRFIGPTVAFIIFWRLHRTQSVRITQ